MSTQIAFRPGYRIRVDKDAAARELLRIHAAHGQRLEVPAIYEAAADPENPIHGQFEWNDEVAGRAHRYEQIRHLIRAVAIVEIRPGRPPRLTPVFVHVDTGPGGGYYQTVTVARENPDEWAAAIRSLMAKRDALDRSVRELERWGAQAHPERAAGLAAIRESLEACKTTLEEIAA